jgi:predicted lipoprotein with Yx(FWY)xxD motif
VNRSPFGAVLIGDGYTGRRGPVMRRTSILLAATAAAVLTMAGCGGSDNGGSSADDGTASAGNGAAGATLATASSDLGTIVVDGAGRTVYVFDRDDPATGASSCSGNCATNWPPVTAEEESPAVDGVTGDVGTIGRDDGTLQVTLDGRPLYTYAADADAGDVTGQGVQGVWWVVAPDGAAVTAVPEAPVPGY